jgi:polar amino acid transport system permease protein
LVLFRRPWHQEWWAAALLGAIPVFAGYPLYVWADALFPLAPSGRDLASLAGFSGLAVVVAVSGAYATRVWWSYLGTAERWRALASFAGYVAFTAAAVLLVRSADVDYDPGVVRRFLFSDLILEGAWRTVYISVVSQALGIVLGLFAALGRTSTNPLFNTVAGGYIWFFRGTPLLVQLLFWFNALPQIIPAASDLTPLQVAIIGLGVNEGAYMSEVVRAGIQSVDPGQTDAAKSLGMTYPLTMRRIVLPQAMRVIIPPTGNEFISMLKNSSLASAITFEELFRRAQTQASSTFRYLELLTVASIWYLVMTTVFTVFQVGLERRYSAGFTRRTARQGFFTRFLRNLAPWRRL